MGYSIAERKLDDGYTQVIVTTDEGNVAVNSYFYDSDRDYTVEGTIKEALDKD